MHNLKGLDMLDNDKSVAIVYSPSIKSWILLIINLIMCKPTLLGINKLRSMTHTNHIALKAIKGINMNIKKKR